MFNREKVIEIGSTIIEPRRLNLRQNIRRYAGRIMITGVAVGVALGITSDHGSAQKPFPDYPEMTFEYNEDTGLNPNIYDTEGIGTEINDVVEGENSFFGGKVKIDGFNVVIKQDEIIKSLKKGEYAQVSLLNYDENEDLPTYKTSVFYRVGNSFDRDPMVNPYQKTLEPGSVSGNGDNSFQAEEDVYLDRGLHSDFSHPQRIRYTVFRLDGASTSLEDEEIPDESIVSEDEVTVKLAKNVDCENNPYISYSGPVVSEVILPNLDRIRLCAYLMDVRSILQMSGFSVVLDKIDSDYMSQDHEDVVQREITLSYPFYRSNIKGVDITRGLVYHESLHALYEMYEEDDPVIKDLSESYKAVVRNMKYRMPTYQESYKGYPITDYEKIWAVITESTYEEDYLGFKESYDGHPWDNPSEMASSIVAVLNGYPRYFVDRFNGLKTNEQHAIRQAVIATVRLINTKPALLDNIIPAHDWIFSNIGINSKDLEY